ncbi:MAG: hypothetical protein KGJ62_02220 [Armatimonadetes bacterium]|nr:hypothetical protein [Armatimonadota bacterium]MDE2205363.1 hypothetical protein [Armatimonadota bacterium]
MKLPSPHARSIAATLGAAEETLRRMAGAGVDGRSPAGAPLAPLCRQDSEALLARLDDLRRAMQAFRTIAGGAPLTAGAPQRSQTVGWLAMLQRQLEDEMLCELDADWLQGRYGAMPEESARELRERCTALRESVRRLGGMIEALRGGEAE